MKITHRIILLVMLFPSLCLGAETLKHKDHKFESGVEKLSPNLRDLLSQEMKALQKGMMSIIPAYVSGNWGKIETTAGKIKSSYIRHYLNFSITRNIKRRY